MDKRKALKILIDHSFFLDEQTKVQLFAKLPELSDDQVEKIGKMLAIEKKKSLNFIKEYLRTEKD